MEAPSIALLLDILLLVALGVTVYYVMRLSRSLNAFRAYRQEFMRVMGELSQNIDRAQATIQSMKSASKSSGEHLQDLLDQSRLLADELQLINEAGNSLAARLEGLAEKNRKAATQAPQASSKPLNGSHAKPKPDFFIQDRDYGDEEPSAREAAIPEGLQSQAERELFEALQRNRKVN